MYQKGYLVTITGIISPALRGDRLVGLPVAIIGAGPVGLAAAANLVERGIDFVVHEAGATIASSVLSWGHIRLFSPWKHLIDPAARRLLEAHGWVEPRRQGSAPFGSELVEQYLAPLAALPSIAPRIHTGISVIAVTRQGMDRTRSTGRESTPFTLRIKDATGSVREILARAVIDASGTYRTENRLGSNGLDPLGIEAVSGHITHALPDVLGSERQRFSGRNITVVGAGHSAANTLINLATLIRTEPSTTVCWIIRSSTAARIFTSDADELPRRATLGDKVQRLIERGIITVIDGFEIIELGVDGDRVDITGLRHGAMEHIATDLIVNATGFHPDLGILREVRTHLDEIVEAPSKLAPLIDPNLHSCGTVEPHGFRELQQPEQNFFIAGMKSYGRAPTFLLATGHEQIRSITAYLAGDLVAAGQVVLRLPVAGVCSTDAGAACCS